MSEKTDKEQSALTNEEADLLQRSILKPKESINQLDPQVTFRDRLVENQQFESMEFDFHMFNNMSLEDEKDNPTNHKNFIPISSAEKHMLYKPWAQALIIKLIGKRMGYNLLRTRNKKTWNTTDPLNLIDLGNDFYLIRISSEILYNKVLNNGP